MICDICCNYNYVYFLTGCVIFFYENDFVFLNEYSERLTNYNTSIISFSIAFMKLEIIGNPLV